MSANPSIRLLPHFEVPDQLPAPHGTPTPPLLSLPTELDELIFEKLEQVDRACVAATCRAAYRLIGGLFYRSRATRQAMVRAGRPDEDVAWASTPPFSAQQYPHLLELLNRVDDGSPWKWLCARCAAWHVFDPRKVQTCWLSKGQGSRQPGATSWHKLNQAPADLCEQEPSPRWIWAGAEGTDGPRAVLFEQSTLTPSLVEVTRLRYLAWTLIRAIVRSNRWANDRRLGPCVTTLDGTAPGLTSLKPRPYQFPCVDTWSGAVTRYGLTMRTRRVWPLPTQAVEELRGSDEVPGGLRSMLIPVDTFMDCMHPEVVYPVRRAAHCLLKHTFQAQSLAADGLQGFREDPGFCDCRQVLRCDVCACEAAADITMKEHEDVDVQALWGEEAVYSPYALAVTRWVFVGDGVVPHFPPVGDMHRGVRRIDPSDDRHPPGRNKGERLRLQFDA